MSTVQQAKANSPSGRREYSPYDDRRIQGIITPLVTPLLDRDSLDVAGLERLIEYVLRGGISGLFLLGTTGEAAALSPALHRELIRCVMQCVGIRVPVFVGISNNSVVESLRMAQEASDCGASAIVLTTPSYLPLNQRELVRYIRMVDQETALPILLYNMPRLTSHWFTVETVFQAMQLENVIGLKDSSEDTSYWREIRSLLVQRPDWSLLTGSEVHLADAVKLGAHGCVSGGSNLCPQLLVNVYHAASTGDEARLCILQQELQELVKIYQFGTYATGVIRGIKCSLEILGICSGRMADPFQTCDEAQQVFIEQQLLTLRLLAPGDAGSEPMSEAAYLDLP